MNFLNSILTIGISPETPIKLASKIQVANGVNFYLLLMSTLWVGVAYLFIPNVIGLVILAILLFGFSMLLAQNSWQLTARFITSITPSVVSFLMHIALIQHQEQPVWGNYLLQMVFIGLPWVIFTDQEKTIRLLSLMICLGFMFLVKPLNFLIEPDEINQILRGEVMGTIFMITGLFILCVEFWMMHFFNAKMESQNENLLSEALKVNQTLLENEQKSKEYYQTIEQNRIEEQQRQWISNGIAGFSDLLRQHTNTDKSLDQLLTFLIKHANFNQGSLYVVEKLDDATVLNLKSCYAYNRKKFEERIIYPGEGLLGQTYYEKEPTYLEVVPKNYIRITSGMGDASPSFVAILPLMYNEEVLGVIELATFKRLEEFEREFLEKATVALAGFLFNQNTTAETKALLDKSILQAESLKTNEEEMRQNLEELHATQEEMAKKQLNLNSFQQMTASILRNIPGSVYRSYTDTNWTMIFISNNTKMI